MSIKRRLSKVMFSSDEIAQKIRRDIAPEVHELVKDIQDPLFICVMNGAIHFFSDMTRQLHIPISYGFLRAQSYEGMESTGQVYVAMQDQFERIKGRQIFLVEDIVDTGRTIVAIRKELFRLGAASIHVVSLLNKPSRRLKECSGLVIDVIGWDIPDEFVVGYGLDLNGQYRNLPYIGVIKEETD